MIASDRSIASSRSRQSAMRALLHAWVPGYSLSLNFPGWSVAVELFFYLVFAMLLLALRGRPTAVLLGIAAIATAV